MLNCFESDREARTQIYTPSGEALTIGEVVDTCNAMSCDVAKLRRVLLSARSIVAYRERYPDCITSLAVDSMVDQLAARCNEV